MSDKPFREVLAGSSLGGDAWCADCKHPDLLHEVSGCFGILNEGDTSWTCSCVKLRPMTPDEWLAWRSQ